VDFEFEWDEEKAASNLKKHGIRFDYAVYAFEDPFRFERADTEGDCGEDRWSITGLIELREFVVVFTIRGPKTRIISARRATNDERRDYWKNRLLYS
jgi:uncharacterized DUF497 family protein